MDPLDDLKDAWKAQKSVLVQPKLSSTDLLHKIRINSNQAKNEHIAIIAMLSVSAFVVGWFFWFYLKAPHWLIHTGSWGMVGSLILRVVIELISLNKFSRLSFSENTKVATQQFKRFYEWRKKLHGNITMGFYLFYSISFLSMTPIFAKHMELYWVIVMVVGFILIMITLVYFARIGIRRELKQLRAIKHLSASLNEEMS
ncbi:MAG: hypothetical protein ACPGJS_02835 [Flammeovirgaceae bacterium]